MLEKLSSLCHFLATDIPTAQTPNARQLSQQERDDETEAQMAKLLFKLSNVPEDEADEVRQLFEEKGFDVYETNAGRWGSGVAAIWLADPSQLADARAALDAYQAQRTERMQQTYAEQLASGQAPTLWHKLTARPWQFIGCILAIGVIAGLMVLPFLGFLS